MHLTNIVDRAGVISPEQGHLSGLTSSHVQRTDEYGGGFFVNVEGLHHLHCLVSGLGIFGQVGRNTNAAITESCEKVLILQLRPL